MSSEIKSLKVFSGHKTLREAWLLYLEAKQYTTNAFRR